MNQLKLSTIEKVLAEAYPMKSKATLNSQSVKFFGTELECYKLAFEHRTKDIEIYICYTECRWCVEFKDWFTKEDAENMIP